ncbi:polysaccharide biosynthesis/export family protein [Sphingomonas sp.]|jgi:polysaccharide export outer membrane protein|uniref:polysaccharide biosynthesis/export family protein n=1 Tax=Sphingomonas sp. TaxID=28214 RepID=UPI002DE657B1|nr:polysaccharide biosynthesis/export family protein [Sphingomonas sp.]
MKIVKHILGGMALLAASVATAQPPAPVPMPQGANLQAQTSPARPPAPATQQQRDVTAGYVLGADDVVEVTVLGQPEFATRARVKANGTIQLPFIGEQKIAGETALTLAPKIAEKLRSGGFYAKPVVNIEIASFASRYVVLLGAVAQAGLQPVDRDYRLSEIIARAGGLRDTGADFVTLTRANGEQRNYPFEKLASGGPDDDPWVSPGDKIFVPEAELFYIYGQINAPGVYPIRGGEMTIRKAVARGGGFTASGSAKRIKLFRDGEETKANLDMVIKPGDVLVVGERLF